MRSEAQACSSPAARRRTGAPASYTSNCITCACTSCSAVGCLIACWCRSAWCNRVSCVRGRRARVHDDAATSRAPCGAPVRWCSWEAGAVGGVAALPGRHGGSSTNRQQDSSRCRLAWRKFLPAGSNQAIHILASNERTIPTSRRPRTRPPHFLQSSPRRQPAAQALQPAFSIAAAQWALSCPAGTSARLVLRPKVTTMAWRRCKRHAAAASCRSPSGPRPRDAASPSTLRVWSAVHLERVVRLCWCCCLLLADTSPSLAQASRTITTRTRRRATLHSSASSRSASARARLQPLLPARSAAACAVLRACNTPKRQPAACACVPPPPSATWHFAHRLQREEEGGATQPQPISRRNSMPLGRRSNPLASPAGARSFNARGAAPESPLASFGSFKGGPPALSRMTSMPVTAGVRARARVRACIMRACMRPRAVWRQLHA